MKGFRSGLALFGAIVLAIGSIGCISSSGYRALTVRDPIASYSLEYPGVYRLDGPRYKNDSKSKYSTVGFVHKIIKQPMKIPDVKKGTWETYTVSYSPLGIIVFVEDVSTHPDLDTGRRILTIDDFIAKHTDNPGFKLLSRGNVTIDGKDVEQIVYEETPLSFITPRDSTTKVTFNKLIIFTYANLFWKLEVASDLELEEEANANFDHLVQSFKILAPISN